MTLAAGYAAITENRSLRPRANKNIIAVRDETVQTSSEGLWF